MNKRHLQRNKKKHNSLSGTKKTYLFIDTTTTIYITETAIERTYLVYKIPFSLFLRLFQQPK